MADERGRSAPVVDFVLGRPRGTHPALDNRLCNVIAWTTFVTVTLSVGVVLLDQIFGLFGKKLF